MWEIQTLTNDRLNIMTLANQTSESGLLNFGSSHEARAFLQWLRENKTEIVTKNGTLQGGKFQLIIDGSITLIVYYSCRYILTVNCNVFKMSFSDYKPSKNLSTTTLTFSFVSSYKIYTLSLILDS